MKSALIIHGAFGNPKENWFPWLKTKLTDGGYEVLVPPLPTPKNQQLDTWLSVVRPYISRLNQESILVGHSIGATFLLTVLEKLGHPVSKTVLVSGFVDDLGNGEFDTINHTFYQKTFDWEGIRNNAGLLTLFHGDNDPYVPLALSHTLAEKLHTEVTVIPKGGHLNADSGFTTFPQLLAVLQ